MKRKSFPTLYAKASTGKVKIWRIHAEETKYGAAIVTEYGYEGSDNLQTTTVEVRKGKNVGRANETTPFQQACLEAESKWNKKQDKKYTQDKSGESDILLPMLAHDYKKRGKDIEWPAYVQPKLDGVRCLATKVSSKEIRYTSRGGKEFTTLEHLTPHLLKMMRKGETFDGELFSLELTFQETVSAIKRAKTENLNTKKIEYWVYDLVLPKVPFRKRTELLGELVVPGLPVVFVDTGLAMDESAMLKAHAMHVQDGFEGTIIRNLDGTYRKDFRSPDLQKYKDFIDEEFVIIGAKEGVGKDKGAVTWICHTEEEKEFDCRPRGTMEQRREWWKHRKKYFGKQLTVRYQNRSDDNIPIFPVGISIREGTYDKDGNFKPDL